MSYPAADAAYYDASGTTPSSNNVSSQQPNGMGTDANIGPKLVYIRTLSGLLKILQFILSLIAIICAAAYVSQGHSNGGYLSFVASIHCILTCVVFFLFFCNVVYRIPHHALALLIYFAVMLLFILIAAILGAVYGSSSSAAASFFFFADLIVTGVDFYFVMRYWRSGDMGPGSKVMIGQTSTEAPSTTTQPYPSGGAPHY